jgi:hypothetical protein
VRMVDCWRTDSGDVGWELRCECRSPLFRVIWLDGAEPGDYHLVCAECGSITCRHGAKCGEKNLKLRADLRPRGSDGV